MRLEGRERPGTRCTGSGWGGTSARRGTSSLSGVGHRTPRGGRRLGAAARWRVGARGRNISSSRSGARPFAPSAGQPSQMTWRLYSASRWGFLYFCHYYEHHSSEYRSYGCSYKIATRKRRNLTSLPKTGVFTCVACQRGGTLQKMKLPLPCSPLSLP